MPQDSLEDLSLLEGTSSAEELDQPQSRVNPRAWRALVLIASIQAVLNVVLLGTGVALYTHRGAKNPIFPQRFYCEYRSASLGLLFD